MTVTESSRKRLSAASKELMDVAATDLVRLRRARGVGCVEEIDETAKWARVRWITGDKAGTTTDHPIASLRKAHKDGAHDLDARTKP